MLGDGLENVALVADSKQNLVVRAIQMPKPGPKQVVVEVTHVAQNPTDVQSCDIAAGDDSVYGCDFAGKVVEVGTNVTKRAVGDVVAALIWGGEIMNLGAYARYTLADEDISFRIPPGLTGASASTIPLAATTSWLALFSDGCLNMNREKKETVLIWGGASSVGQYAIQIALLYSFTVITTCSPKSFDLVKSLGATHVFDYNTPDVADRIREVAPGLQYVFDTIGRGNTSAISSQAAEPHATLCTVRPGKANIENVPESVKVTDVLVWTAFLKDHSYGTFSWPANQADHQLCTDFYDKLPEWISQGKITPNEVVLFHGLQSVSEGFQMYREGKISGQKIVYEL